MGATIVVSSEETPAAAAGDAVKAITCNALVASSAVSERARAFLLQLAGDRARVLIRSRSGRWITVWRRIKDLTHFRFKTLSESHPMFSRMLDATIANTLTKSDIECLNGFSRDSL